MFRIPLSILCLCVACAAASSAPDDQAERLRKTYNLPAGDAELLQAVGKKLLKEQPAEVVAKAIRDLGSDDYRTREDAVPLLTSCGPSILPDLRKALADQNAERAKRAGEVIAAINGSWGAPQLASFRASVYLVCQRRPEGTLPVLLRALPLLAEDALAEDVWAAADAICAGAGGPDRVVEEAAKDTSPDRRALAAYLLGRRGTDQQRKLAQQLLQDRDPEVRLRAAQGLLGSGDFAGVPVLIDLLTADPPPVAWQAEELLTWIAGDEAPVPTWGLARTLYWREWWARTKKGIDFRTLAAEPRRPTLFLTHTGRVFGCDGRVRWELQADPATRYAPTFGFGEHPVLVTQILSSGHALGIARVAREENSLLPEPKYAFEADVRGRWIWSRSVGIWPSPVEGLCARWPLGSTLFAGDGSFGIRSAQGQAKAFLLDLPKPNGDESGDVKSKFAKSDGFVLWYGGVRGQKEELVGLYVFDPASGRQLQADVDKPTWPPRGDLIVGRGKIVAELDRELPAAWERARLVERDAAGRAVWAVPLPGDVWRLTTVFPRLRLGFDDLPVQRVDLAKATDYWVRQLEHPSPRRRVLAMYAIRDDLKGSALPAVRGILGSYALGEALRSYPNNPGWGMVADLAPEAMGVCGKGWPDAVRAAYKDESPLVRAGALLMTWRYAKREFTEEEWFAAIRRGVDDPDPEVRRAAATIIPHNRYRASEISAIFRKLLEDNRNPKSGGKSPAFQASQNARRYSELWTGEDTKRVVESLKATLAKNDPELTRSSLVTLGVIGRRRQDLADAVLPTLTEHLAETKSDRVRIAAANGIEALKRFGKPAAPALLKAWAANPSAELRRDLSTAISEIGSDASEVVPQLTRMLAAAKTSQERIDLAYALGSFGKEAASALPELRKARTAAENSSDFTLLGQLNHSISQIEK